MPGKPPLWKKPVSRSRSDSGKQTLAKTSRPPMERRRSSGVSPFFGRSCTRLPKWVQRSISPCSGQRQICSLRRMFCCADFDICKASSQRSSQNPHDRQIAPCQQGCICRWPDSFHRLETPSPHGPVIFKSSGIGPAAYVVSPDQRSPCISEAGRDRKPFHRR